LESHLARHVVYELPPRTALYIAPPLHQPLQVSCAVGSLSRTGRLECQIAQEPVHVAVHERTLSS